MQEKVGKNTFKMHQRLCITSTQVTTQGFMLLMPTHIEPNGCLLLGLHRSRSVRTFVCQTSSEKIKQKKKRNILHHYNASSHTLTQTKEFLILPRILPALIWHFILDLQNKLRSQWFSTFEKAVDVFKMYVLEFFYSYWKRCFENLFKRMQNCIDHHGEYSKKVSFNDKYLVFS